MQKSRQILLTVPTQYFSCTETVVNVFGASKPIGVSTHLYQPKIDYKNHVFFYFFIGGLCPKSLLVYIGPRIPFSHNFQECILNIDVGDNGTNHLRCYRYVEKL